MNLYKISIKREGEFWVIAEHPTAAFEKIKEYYKGAFETDQYGSPSIEFDTIQLIATSINKDSLIVPSLYRLVL